MSNMDNVLLCAAMAWALVFVILGVAKLLVYLQTRREIKKFEKEFKINLDDCE